MSKEENLLQKQRSVSFHNRPRHNRNHQPVHAGKIKKKIFQKQKFSLNHHKKFSPSKSKKENWFSRKIKCPGKKKDQPPTPHNTTQFIVDAVYFPTDPRIYEYDNDRLEYNFEHHAMAGSMMELMQQRLEKDKIEHPNPQARSPTVPENAMEEEEDDILLDAAIPKLRLVKSADDCHAVACDSDDSTNSASFEYDRLLNDAKSGKDLQGVIKELVNVIRRKDSQINSLLLNTQKKELIHGS